MNVAEEVRSRRLTAVLEEALGDAVPTDLEERALQRVQSAPASKVRSFPALAAVTLLAGVLVVCLVAWLRTSRDEATPLQDPQKADGVVVIDLTAPTPGDGANAIDAPAGDAVARASGIARSAGLDIVIVGAIAGESKVALQGLTGREAIEAIAVEQQVGLAEYGSTLLLGVGRVPTPKSRATFGSDVAVDALKVLHARGGANVVVATDRLDRRLRLDVRDRPSRTVLDAVAGGLGTHVVGRGNVSAMVPDAVPRPAGRRVQEADGYEFAGPGTLGAAIALWSRVASANVFIDQKVDASIQRFACGGADVREHLFVLAEAARADVRRAEGIFHVEPRLANDTGITLTAENMSLRELVEMSWMTQQPNVEIADGVDAKLTVFVANALWFDVLRAAAVAAGRQFVRTEKGYRIE